MKNLLWTLMLMPAFAFASGATPPPAGTETAPTATNNTCLAYSQAAVEKLAKIDTRLLLDDDQMMFSKSIDDLRAGVAKAQADNNASDTSGKVIVIETDWVNTCYGAKALDLARQQAKLECLEKYETCKELSTDIIGHSDCSEKAKSIFVGRNPR